MRGILGNAPDVCQSRPRDAVSSTIERRIVRRVRVRDTRGFRRQLAGGTTNGCVRTGRRLTVESFL
jgi:hypothetical protein